MHRSESLTRGLAFLVRCSSNHATYTRSATNGIVTCCQDLSGQASCGSEPSSTSRSAPRYFRHRSPAPKLHSARIRCWYLTCWYLSDRDYCDVALGSTRSSDDAQVPTVSMGLTLSTRPPHCMQSRCHADAMLALHALVELVNVQPCSHAMQYRCMKAPPCSAIGHHVQ